MNLTNAELDELEKLERAATAGPWVSVGDVYIFGADNEPFEAGESDVAFTVAARNALPALLAMARENEELRSTRHAMAENFYRMSKKAYGLSVDLLATRRALKMAQAKALGHLANRYWRGCLEVDERQLRREQCLRAELLCLHYAAKFEREAGEM
jgi:hypothetical protein